jgi:hypothetical protein
MTSRRTWWGDRCRMSRRRTASSSPWLPQPCCCSSRRSSARSGGRGAPGRKGVRRQACLAIERGRPGLRRRGRGAPRLHRTALDRSAARRTRRGGMDARARRPESGHRARQAHPAPFEAGRTRLREQVTAARSAEAERGTDHPCDRAQPEARSTSGRRSSCGCTRPPRGRQLPAGASGSGGRAATELNAMTWERGSGPSVGRLVRVPGDQRPSPSRPPASARATCPCPRPGPRCPPCGTGNSSRSA